MHWPVLTDLLCRFTDVAAGIEGLKEHPEQWFSDSGCVPESGCLVETQVSGLQTQRF